MATTVACGDSTAAGSAEGNCRRYVKLVDDVRAGKVDGQAEFLQRLDSDVGEFKEGTGLRRAYDRLQESITKDEPGLISDNVNALADDCLDVLDR